VTLPLVSMEMTRQSENVFIQNAIVFNPETPNSNPLRSVSCLSCVDD
jgi:hypothetical protein